MSKSIAAAIAANGWSTKTWAGQTIASKEGHVLTIDGNWARWEAPYPSGGTFDNGIVEGVRAIVSVLKDPNAAA